MSLRIPINYLSWEDLHGMHSLMPPPCLQNHQFFTATILDAIHKSLSSFAGYIACNRQLALEFHLAHLPHRTYAVELYFTFRMQHISSSICFFIVTKSHWTVDKVSRRVLRVLQKGLMQNPSKQPPMLALKSIKGLFNNECPEKHNVHQILMFCDRGMDYSAVFMLIMIDSHINGDQMELVQKCCC